VIGPRNRTAAYGAQREQELLDTVPGQADFAVPGSPDSCGGCIHFRKAGRGRGRCAEYAPLVGKLGAMLPVAQTACRRFQCREDGRAPRHERRRYERRRRARLVCQAQDVGLRARGAAHEDQARALGALALLYRTVLWAGHARWEAAMSPAERAEQGEKISRAALAEDRSARDARMWAKRSSRNRKAVGAKIAAGLNKFWAGASLERRKAQSAAANAVLTSEQRSARMRATNARISLARLRAFMESKS
jgi:hypothetical protein